MAKARVVSLGVLVLAGGVAPPAAVANEADDASSNLENSVVTAVRDGVFLPLTMPARVGPIHAYAWGLGGFDSSRTAPLVESTTEVHLWGPLALRGSATYNSDIRRMRPSIGVRGQILHQQAHGIDGAISISYKAEGFTEPEGEIETLISIARAFDRISVFGNFAYGQDPEGNERDGEVRASILRAQAGFLLGLDSRLRFAIGPQRGKSAAAEPTLDALAGLLAIKQLKWLVLFAQAGPSAFSQSGTSMHVGFAALGGIGTAF